MLSRTYPACLCCCFLAVSLAGPPSICVAEGASGANAVGTVVAAGAAGAANVVGAAGAAAASGALQSTSTATQIPLGTAPPPATVPRLEFAFEFRVTLAPAVVLGDTIFGHRQYIAITGGAIAGPKFTGEVLPGGWDYQLGLADGCSMLSADYFIRAKDGTLIHVLNEGLSCRPKGDDGQRMYFRPRFEAPKGVYDWLTRGTFIATLELEPPTPQPGTNAPPVLNAIRLKFYQVQ